MVKVNLSDINVPELIADIWSPLNDEQREFLANHFTLQNYKKNEVIHCEGETPTHLMCLLSGKVKIYKTVSLFGDANMAGMLRGTASPVVVPSRADSGNSKYYSLALACVAG